MGAAEIRNHRIVIVPVGAFIAWSFWYLEIFVVRGGWRSLTWLSGFNWSAIPICILIASVCAFVVEPHPNRSRPLVFVACASILFLAAFLMSKAAWEQFYANAFGAAFQPPLPFDYTPVVQHAYAGLGVSLVLPLLARWTLGPMRLWTIATLAAALLSILPVSALLHWLDLLHTGRGSLDDIKFGYPVFLAALFAPLVMHFGSQRITPQ